MPENKKQMRRLVMLVAELKKNNYPNTKTFTEKLSKLERYENQNIACTEKTIQRDIKYLKDVHGAPIAYDPKNRGYYLRHHGWNFSWPEFEDRDMVAAVLGVKVAEAIFPNPLRGEARDAIDNLLAENNPDILDTAVIDALVVASGLEVSIAPRIFQAIFVAWSRRKSVKIWYRASSGVETTRLVDPHVLAYRDSSWFIKAYCHLRGDLRTFAIHRIREAELAGTGFDVDIDLIRRVSEEGIFDYKPIKNLEIECAAEIAPYVSERPLHSRQTREKLENGDIVLRIPSAYERDVISWILARAGKAKVLAPKKLREQIAAIAAAIRDGHSKS